MLILPTSDPAGARIAALRGAARNGNLPSDDELRELWRTAGGTEVPNADVLAMDAEFLLPLLRTMIANL